MPDLVERKFEGGVTRKDLKALYAGVCRHPRLYGVSTVACCYVMDTLVHASSGTERRWESGTRRKEIGSAEV